MKYFFKKAFIWLQVGLIVLQLVAGVISFQSPLLASAKELNNEEIGVERIELREADSKTYELTDGEMQKESFSGNIHFKSGDQWVEINNNIIKTDEDGYVYRNSANDFIVYMGGDASQGIKVQYKDVAYKMKIETNNSIPSKLIVNGNKAIFTEVFDSVDWEITFVNEGFQSEIIIKDESVIQTEYPFIIESDFGSEIQILEGGSIGVFKDNNLIWQTDPAVMYDAEYEYKEVDIQQEERKVTEKSEAKNAATASAILPSEKDYSQVLKLVIDNEWLIDPERQFPIKVDPSLSVSIAKDTFISTTTLNPDNGARRMMPIGRYTDYTMAGNPTFGKSRALIDFKDINLPSNAIITSSNLEVYHYGTNTGNKAIYVTLPTTSWTERIVWPGPNINNVDYGHTTFPYYNSGKFGVAVKRTISLNTSIIPALNNIGNGLMIRNYDEAARGVVVCSSNIPSGPCLSGMQPKLVVNYYLNQKPNPPELMFPGDGTSFGANSILLDVECDDSGQGLGCDMTFKLNIVDPDNNVPLTTIVEITNNAGGSQELNIVGAGDISKQIYLNDGDWSWRAKTIDGYDLVGNWSVTKYFLIDTTAPDIPILLTEPIFTVSDNNEMVVDIADYSGIKYGFEISESEAFESILNTSGWMDSKSYIFQNLFHNTKYYYRVMAQDELENISDWSETIFSTQDNVFPNIQNIDLTPSIISPKNQDGVSDVAELSFQIEEEYLDSVNLNVYNQDDELVFSKENLESYEVNIEGKDNNGDYLDDDIYKVFIEASDFAGNATISDEILLRIDNDSPPLNISSPKDGSWFHTDEISISGITEVGSQTSLYNSHLDFVYNIEEDLSTGIFNQEINITNGINNIKVESIDAAYNSNVMELDLFKESIAPGIIINSPKGIINNAQFEILMSVEDFGFADDSIEYISGLDLDSLNLSLKNSNGDKIILVTDGQDISELGELIITCQEFTSVGLNRANDCEVKYIFNNNLDPNGEFQIIASIDDVAGNSSDIVDSYFELDTHTLLEVNNHTDGEVLNYSNIKLTGVGEYGSTLNITGDVDEISFHLDPDTAQDGMSILNCVESTSPESDGIKQICSWEVAAFQLVKDVVEGNSVENNIEFILTDSANNIVNISHKYLVDLYAVNLQVDTNIKYFSPNGDGRQDGIEFLNMSTDGQVDSWSINIYDVDNLLVKNLNGVGSLPSNIFWDGRYNEIHFGVESEVWASDGDYTYELEVVTTDGIPIRTLLSNLYARTSLLDEVIITSPKDGIVTTSGVINVQGQAPKNTEVKICVDTIGLDSACDFEYKVDVDENSSFSMIMPLIRLPNLSETHHIISAIAYDEYGNKTEASNTVEIIVDTNDPFISFSAIPALTGVNKEDEYQMILDKLDNGEDIIQADIDNLRSIILRAEVTGNTKYVSFEYRDLVNLEELPEVLETGYLGFVDGNNQSYLYKEISESTQSCEGNSCVWDFYYPVPPLNGGLYEIFATAKKGELSERLSASVLIDGTLPSAPAIIGINKILDNQTSRLPIYLDKYYSNSSLVEVIGVSDVDMNISVLDSDNNKLCDTKSNGVGIFVCQIELSDFYSEYDSNNIEIKLSVVASDGLNETHSISEEILILDMINPEIVSFDTPNKWVNSGVNVDVKVTGNEELSLSYIETPENVKFKLLIDDLYLNTLGYFQIPSNVKSGIYLIEVSIVDLAGNKTTKLKGFFIDDYTPDASHIEKSTISKEILWGQNNGINIVDGIPAAGRLVPNYVYKEGKLQVHGYAEKYSQVRIYLDNEVLDTVTMDETNCTQIVEDILSDDDIILKSGEVCLWQTEINFIKEKGHVLYTKVMDRAGNVSDLSNDEVVYFDKAKPISSSVLNITPEGGKKYVEGINVNLTNGIDLSFLIDAESLSDIEINLIALVQSQSSYKFGQTLGNGTYDFNLSLGEDADTGECIEVQSSKRVGICEDGEYIVEMKSTDAAGNISNITTHKVERDTVAPSKTTVSEPYICSNNICIDIAGESGAKLIINNRTTGTFSNYKSNKYIVKFNWLSNKEYTFNMKQVDVVDNISEVVSKKITTPAVLGMGDQDYYDSIQNDDIIRSSFNVYVDMATEGYQISDIRIPAPILTGTYTSAEGKVEIFGAGVYKNDLLDASITVEYTTYNQAKEKCDVNTLKIFWNEDDKVCIREKTGNDNLEEYYALVKDTCNPSLPPVNLICAAYMHSNWRYKSFEEKIIKIDHAAINFKNKTTNDHLSTIWNTKDVRFQYATVLNSDLSVGDKVVAKSTIYGDFEYKDIKIDYRGTTEKSAAQNQGLSSVYSNVLSIQAPLSFIDSVVSPVQKCDAVYWTSPYGYRKYDGKIKFHNGVDLAQWGGCNISAVMDGDARTSYSTGNTVVIEHDDKYKTLYGHGKNFIGNYPRKVSSSENTMYMGNTGNSSGVHLHFMVYEGGNHVDPYLYFKKYLDEIPKTYNVQKHKDLNPDFTYFQ